MLRSADYCCERSSLSLSQSGTHLLVLQDGFDLGTFSAISHAELARASQFYRHNDFSNYATAEHSDRDRTDDESLAHQTS